MKIKDIDLKDNSTGMMVLKNLTLIIHLKIETWFNKNDTLTKDHYQFLIECSIREFADIIKKV